MLRPFCVCHRPGPAGLLHREAELFAGIGRDSHLHPYRRFERWKEWEMSVLRHRATGATSGSSTTSTSTLTDSELMLNCPGLVEHLTSLVMPDGTPRVTSSLSIFMSDVGDLRACLTDKEQRQKAFVSGSSLQSLLSSLELLLQSDGLDWRPDNWAARTRTGKKRP
jgi:hypothetical protein